MTKLSWLTAAGSIANFPIGLSSSVRVQAYDTNYTETNLTYQVISGLIPIGMSMSTDGIISGTPTYSNPSNNTFTKLDFNFIVRVRAPDGSAIDRGFTIFVTNVITGDFTWVTPTGDLGTVPAGQFYSLQLEAIGPSGSNITYSRVSGNIPDGMQLTKSGSLQGVPTLLTAITANSEKSKTSRFTIRATDTVTGFIVDRSFSLGITLLKGPEVHPTTDLLGAFFDGTYFEQQLTVLELGSIVPVQWSIKDGELPAGIVLDSNTGLLSGYIQPLQLVGNFGPAGYDGDEVVQDVITQQHEYDLGPYDFNQLNQSLNYSFTVQAYDGANYDLQHYTIDIVSRSGFTADSTNPVNDTYLTSDAKNVYIPVILNATTMLPAGRQNSYYAYKFEGYDFAGDSITYNISNASGTFDSGAFDSGWIGDGERDPSTDFNNGLPGSFDLISESNSNLPGLLLDAQTGWLYGKINPQTIALAEFTFGVQASKTVNGITYTSVPVYFTLPVLGDINNIVEWVSPSNLGIINNGTVSELNVNAKSIVGKELIYTLYDYKNVPARLPQGLKLLPSGDISGRVSFESFSVDDYATTFDGDKLTIDRQYKFTVKAETIDGTASSFREFTISLGIIDQEPYENLYLKAMPAFDQRQIYNSVVSDATIFPEELIYRSQDPWFGVNTDMTMLFIAGLTSATLNEYETAIAQNHWTKTYNFDGIKTAVVLDDFYNVKYEVVYVNVIDPELNSAGQGAAMVVDLSNTIANPYIDALGNEYTVVHPNNSNNMISQLENNIGYIDQSSLPPWMTSNQLNPANPGKFQQPLGFVKAVVLAYTVPGASSLIAYRLKNAGIKFSNIQFTVDRYQVDSFYSNYYDSVTNMYIPGQETTFDKLPNKNVGTIVARINYAVNVPFSEINGRPISYILNNGGIDGIKDFKTGDTIVFAQQEGFLNPGPYDGWVSYSDGWIGDNINTDTVEGYGSEGYDIYSVIPGYLEYVQSNYELQNQRGGIWQIQIVGDIVHLEFIKEIEVNQRVQVINGKSYSSSILYYNPIVSTGNTVPAYTVFQLSTNAVKTPTTFNAGTTKFFSNRDQYYTPGTQDKYLKFPQYGVFK